MLMLLACGPPSKNHHFKTHRYGEQTDGCQTGKVLGDLVKNLKGLGITNW